VAQLELKSFDIRLAKDNGEGHDPCPVGMRVWLDVPANPQKADWECSFQEFSVVADDRDANKRRLQPAGAAPGSSARLDTSLCYWCIWSPAGGPAITPPAVWDRIDGFGYPLRAEASNTRQLILPNSRNLYLREFNLSGTNLQSTAGVQVCYESAQRLCEELHIRLTIEAQQKPAQFPDLASTRISNVPLLCGSGDPDHTRVVLPLNDPPWAAQGQDAGKRITLVWIARCDATTARGESLVVPLVCPDVIRYRLPGPDPAGLAPKRAAIFMDTAKAGGRSLAHEMVHCLLADPGLGRNNHQKGAGWADNVKGVLRALHLRTPVDELYNSLPATEHETNPTTNLMRIDGGNGSIGQPGLLTYLQVALIRRAPELRWC
jgi:hypothetical protein